MGDMLSQAEIDALLNGTPADSSADAQPDSSAKGGTDSDGLSPQEIDALGEIGNISMGTSATTLFTLLGQKVTITTPQVSISTWDQIAADYSNSFVAVRVEYTKGLKGSNLMVLKENDVKVITDLMMGGDGSNTSEGLSDMHLSAIGEAMNQMIGSASTSMSAMFGKRIDISPPRAFKFDIESVKKSSDIDIKKKIVKIAFKMVVGDIIDSEIMQLLPIPFAKKMVENLLVMDAGSGTYEIPQDHDVPQKQQRAAEEVNSAAQEAAPVRQQPVTAVPRPQIQPQQANNQAGYGYEQNYGQESGGYRQQREPVNVQPAHFQNFDEDRIVLEKRNISLIMDVPLQVTVELGRTRKLIKEILEYGPGSIIELDKLAGEPVDILVNGKPIAKGEVVVIDESFGVRITDIIHPSKRL